MSYQISLGLLQDISRTTTVYQSFLLELQSYNHKKIRTPPVHLSHPNWDFQYAVLGSQKQIIKFYLYSLQHNRFMEIIGVGKLDIREFLATHHHNNPAYFQTKLPIDCYYNNQVLLHLKCEHRDQFRSRNDALKVVRSPASKVGHGIFSKYYSNTNNYDDTNIVNQWQTKKQNVPFFKGPCEGRNFFSFLDSIYKGQTYNFIQPSKR